MDDFDLYSKITNLAIGYLFADVCMSGAFLTTPMPKDWGSDVHQMHLDYIKNGDPPAIGPISYAAKRLAMRMCEKRLYAALERESAENERISEELPGPKKSAY